MPAGQVQPKDAYFMRMAFEAASGSKCVRAQYGSVIVSRDGRVVSTAYNGKPRGSTCDQHCFRLGLPANSPKENCCLHSEANAIMFSDPLARAGGTLYVSGVPCNDCALTIMQSGVARLVYFAGETAHGHRGSSDDSFWEKYGSQIVRVPFTFEVAAFEVSLAVAEGGDS
jgi:dCMP deaminase